MKKSALYEQYSKIKEKYPDALVLFRVGDFYEAFNEDAVKASEILGITLVTKSDESGINSVCGFTYHSVDTYLPKLVRMGTRVALCDPLEKPSYSFKKRGEFPDKSGQYQLPI